MEIIEYIWRKLKCKLKIMSIFHKNKRKKCGILLSFPSWERGLKCVLHGQRMGDKESFPSWERGLKFTELGLGKH